jgi:hypothetical protein
MGQVFLKHPVEYFIDQLIVVQLVITVPAFMQPGYLSQCSQRPITKHVVGLSNRAFINASQTADYFEEVMLKN